MKPNWTDIDKCPIWKALGVIECNFCDSVNHCWEPEEELERTPEDEEFTQSLRAMISEKLGRKYG